jgi:RNA polymerase sigma factor (TIGR02999 family)
MADAEKTQSHFQKPRTADELFPLVYTELRQLAAARLDHERPGQTLQPTALVHEVYLRITGSDRPQNWESQGHLFAAAAEAMRRILVESARRKGRQKRGGQFRRVDLSVDEFSAQMDDEELESLDAALDRLEAIDPVKARLVVMRFFGGMSIEQACEVLGISRTTAHRYWAFARAWLYREMTRGN